MPTVSRFYGIDIRLNYADHPPPHFHAFYGRHAARIDIEHPCQRRLANLDELQARARAVNARLAD
jgi:hypothetical protein